MTRPRDTQRSRVYAWERAACAEVAGRDIFAPEFAKLEDCQAFADPIWRAERGRVGLARATAPAIERPSWGQRRGLAFVGKGRITLPRWARSRWVILHEMAHHLTPRDEAHGPRFVGVLIGLLARHMRLDADVLMRMAQEAGVAFHVRSVGLVPVLTLAERVERILRAHGAMADMDIAAHLNVADGVPCSVFQVRGAVLALARAGRVERHRGRVRIPPPPPAAPPKPKVQRPAGGFAGLRDAAAKLGICVERDGPGSYWVTCDKFPVDECDDDPLEGGHWCADLAEARAKVATYTQAIEAATTKEAA